MRGGIEHRSDRAETQKRHKRGHGDGGIHQRADGRWEARLDLPNGKRKSLYGKTRAEVRDKLAAAMRDQEDGLDLTVRDRALARFLDDWLESTARPTLRPKTYDSYSQLARLYLKPHLGNVKLSALTPLHVQKMMRAMSAAGLSPRTVQYARAVLRRALGYAVKWGMVRQNAAALADPPRSERKPVHPLDAAQARAFLDHVRAADGRYWPFFVTAVTTGLRQAELLGLRWADVDLDAGTLRVRHTLQRIDGAWRFVEPKTKRSARTLSLPAATVAALREQRDRQAFERKAAGGAWAGMALVFTTPKGTPLEPSNLHKRLQGLLDGAGLPRQGMHALRHCCASLLLAQGVSPRVVMEQLGHSQISLTMDTYSHVMPAMMKDAANALDVALGATGTA